MPAPDARFHAVHAPVLGLHEGGGVSVVVRTRGRTPLRVDLRTEPDHEERLVELRPVAAGGAGDTPWRTYAGTLQPVEHDLVTHYAFRFVFPREQRWLAQDGLTPFAPALDRHFRLVPGYRPAAWVWDQVFYQVFPERFRDGDPANNVRSGDYLYDGEPVVAKAWDELPARGQGAREFFGGDLDGVAEALPYLADLGVTALYLNPIFAAPSSHKYDTVDYGRVDPHLGGDAAFGRLLHALRARGMRIVLDAVVNHTSERHPWFGKGDPYPPLAEGAAADEARAAPTVGGAYQDPASPTRDHYVFDDPGDPESYRGWLGVRTLPVLDFGSERVRDEVYAGRDAILRRWLRDPWRIDGWRLDVAHMMGRGPGAAGNHDLLREIRAAVREERGDAYLLGEHFFEAGDWLQGDQEDGAMNYDGFMRPLLAFLGGVDVRGHGAAIDARDLDAWLVRARARLPFPIQLSQLNLLGSHDSPRIRTLLGDVRLVAAAQHALFTYVGVPCVYYGDEIGLEGGPDPDCRRPFPWDEGRWEHGLRRLVRTLARLRRRAPPLARGAIETLLAEGDAFAYARVLDGAAVVTALHRGTRPRAVVLPVWATGVAGPWHDVASGDAHPAGDLLNVTLPARGAFTLVSDGAWCDDGEGGRGAEDAVAHVGHLVPDGTHGAA